MCLDGCQLEVTTHKSQARMQLDFCTKYMLKAAPRISTAHCKGMIKLLFDDEA